MPQNARVTTVTVSELLKENQQGGNKTNPTPRLGLMIRIFRALSKFLLYGFHTVFGW